MKQFHATLTYHKNNIYDPTARSFKERIFHASLFEFIALLIVSPLFALIMDRSISSIGFAAFIIATIAIMWNFIYNAIFDRITRNFIKDRTLVIRIVHALLFEFGLIIFTIPLIAWILSITLLDAFILDIGIILFFLPYTVAFNWVYDTYRKSMWATHKQKSQQQH